MKKVTIEDNNPQNLDEHSDSFGEQLGQSSGKKTQQPANKTSQNPATDEGAVSTEAVAAQPNATAELVSDLQRTRADFENYRKQVESQKSLAISGAKYVTVEKFLPLIDDFERALDTYPEQLAPLRKNLNKTLSALDLARINSEPGTEFNPDLHEAVSVEDDEGDTEVIAETLRPGYTYEGSVIRAAMVKVKHK